MEVVLTTTQKEHLEGQREEIERVQTMLIKALGAFRPHPRIDIYMEQFDASNYGVKHRYKPLGLFWGVPNWEVQ